MESGSPWWAEFISYFIGTMAMLAIAITSGEPWLSKSMAERTSGIMWTSGIFGAIFHRHGDPYGASPLRRNSAYSDCRRQMPCSLVFEDLLGVPQSTMSEYYLPRTAFGSR
jgi:hypothetical protein